MLKPSLSIPATPQSSPAVGRAIAVLNFLAGHPDQAFTLTELTKALRISSATGHDLLAALTGAGYVHRTAGKTYVLGPALALVAQASLSPALVGQVTRPEMRVLADEFDLICTAYHLENEKLVVRERASAASHVDWSSVLLYSMSSTAPVGVIFKAWKQAEFEQWVAAADPPLDEKQRDRLDASVVFLRARGFTFAVQLESSGVPDQRTYSAESSLRANAFYRPAYVSVPVFSSVGEVAFALSLTGFRTDVKGAQIEAMGSRLKEVADRIGAFIAGRNIV